MNENKRAPVQGFPGGIPWELHLEAYAEYSRRYAPQPALIEGGCRGGFHPGELDMLIPGWRERFAVIDAARAEVAALRAENERLRADAERYRWLRDIGDATWQPLRARAGFSTDKADAAIDAARAAQGEQG